MQSPEFNSHLTPKRRKTKRERVYFGSQFQRLQVIAAWPHCLWTCNKADHHGGSTGQKRRLTLCQSGGRERLGRGQCSQYLFRGTPPMTYFLPLSSTSWRVYHLQSCPQSLTWESLGLHFKVQQDLNFGHWFWVSPHIALSSVRWPHGHQWTSLPTLPFQL
jgi:hypothetical protein